MSTPSTSGGTAARRYAEPRVSADTDAEVAPSGVRQATTARPSGNPAPTATDASTTHTQGPTTGSTGATRVPVTPIAPHTTQNAAHGAQARRRSAASGTSRAAGICTTFHTESSTAARAVENPCAS